MDNPAAHERKQIRKESTEIKRSARAVERSAIELSDSADRRTILAGDRTLLAAERTYAHPDIKPIPAALLVPMNFFLLLVAVAALVGIWLA